jgi:hypothetical protein
MSRNAHDATWRACRRFVDILLAGVATELTADKPSGINVTAPAAGAYYILPSARHVRDHLEKNHNVQVYVHPSSERVRVNRTVGPTVKSMPTHIEITIAVHVLVEAGAAPKVETWKTLSTLEREMLRCETLLGAIQDVVDGQMRGPAVTGDDIVQVEWLRSKSGDDSYLRSTDEPGIWGSQTWRVRQIINVPQQE